MNSAENRLTISRYEPLSFSVDLGYRRVTVFTGRSQSTTQTGRVSDPDPELIHGTSEREVSLSFVLGVVERVKNLQ